MLKIQQFVKEQFGIELTKQQLEIIAIIAAGNDSTVIMRPVRAAGTTTAYKAALAYLQDGLKEAPKAEHETL